MLAVDTNVVVRYLVNDDPIQFARAAGLIEQNEIFLGATVALETEWVLRRTYGYSASQCIAALAAFCGLHSVTVADEAVITALGWARSGLDFADALHLARAHGCDALISFDQAFAKMAKTLGTLPVRAP